MAIVAARDEADRIVDTVTALKKALLGIDVRVAEINLRLEHRATGKTLAGFVHRGRQLRDFLGVHTSRRRG